MTEETIAVRKVTLWLCDPCLYGAGGECHTPGCALWINRAPDIPLRDNPGVTVHEPEPALTVAAVDPARMEALGELADAAQEMRGDG